MSRGKSNPPAQLATESLTFAVAPLRGQATAGGVTYPMSNITNRFGADGGFPLPNGIPRACHSDATAGAGQVQNNSEPQLSTLN